MNEIMMNENYGREHLAELIAEAENERLARRAMQAQPRRKPLARLRSLLSKPQVR